MRQGTREPCACRVGGAIFVMMAFACCAAATATEPPTREEARAALRKAVGFLRQKVSVQGGYVWLYSADLAKREGEGKVGATTVWVQPPGTPAVGEALVEAYELAGEPCCLDAARESAMVLLRGQLQSGGWDASIELDPNARRRYAYRVDGAPPAKARNNTSLDDDKTQSALRFLVRCDKAAGFAGKPIHEAALFALDSLLKAQFPNGGWPHVYSGPAAAGKYPPRPAGYRQDGQYTRVKAYWEFCTLNDNLVADVVKTLLCAWRTYGDERARQSALKAGGFLILAQMPDPQPAWAQQYDFDMCPAWARKFEPPAITGGESQQAMTTLLDLYELTGDRKYLSPVPKALAYFRASLLPDGRLARFYELRTNKPLYFTLDYQITYSDANTPTHYAFKVGSRLDRIEARYKALADRPWRPPATRAARPSRPSPAAIRRIIDAMDDRGAWVEDGRLRYWGKDDPTTQVIDPKTFIAYIRTLAAYVSQQ